MASMFAASLFLWTSLRSVTAIALCNDSIIDQLAKIPECYNNGIPPSQSSSGNLGTVITLSDDLPDNLKCITSYRNESGGHTTYFFPSNNITTDNSQIVYSSRIVETDSNGVKYHLHIIHNQNQCYSYYRCLADCAAANTGTPSVVIAVRCRYAENPETQKIVRRATMCFDKLGIHNYFSVTPCDC